MNIGCTSRPLGRLATSSGFAFDCIIAMANGKLKNKSAYKNSKLE